MCTVILISLNDSSVNLTQRAIKGTHFVISILLLILVEFLILPITSGDSSNGVKGNCSIPTEAPHLLHNPENQTVSFTRGKEKYILIIIVQNK